MALTRYLSSEIWEVSADDPGAFVSFTLVLAAIAVFACLAPTLRAVKIDPTIALRYE
jgi:putative ABC transport system permease protein